MIILHGKQIRRRNGVVFREVRASGSMIRGFEGAAGGVIRWVRIVNDTAVAVDQLGVRAGAVAVYLDDGTETCRNSFSFGQITAMRE